MIDIYALCTNSAAPYCVLFLNMGRVILAELEERFGQLRSRYGQRKPNMAVLASGPLLRRRTENFRAGRVAQMSLRSLVLSR